MRHYYQEWGRWMNRTPSKPDLPYSEPVAVAAE
jgi:methanesulfonate monooxygenase large subunit